MTSGLPSGMRVAEGAALVVGNTRSDAGTDGISSEVIDLSAAEARRPHDRKVVAGAVR
ncbi:MAG TPA: hypothetical protein VLT15_00370 [Acidimicrobiia bacterium]|nr:hypothetical protein [Acidimicrobiia bacterium]